MGKYFKIIVGLILVALPIYLICEFNVLSYFLSFIVMSMSLIIILIGLILLWLGISKLKEEIE